MQENGDQNNSECGQFSRIAQRCVMQFGTIFTIKKKREKHPWRSVTFSKVPGLHTKY